MLLMMVVPRLWASGSSVPANIPGVETLSAQSLILLAQGVDDLKLIDARLAEDRSSGYIESAIALPDPDSICARLKSSVTNKDQALVFYSNSSNCSRSSKAINKALDCGYTRVYWLRGGFEEWRRSDYPYLLE